MGSPAETTSLLKTLYRVETFLRYDLAKILDNPPAGHLEPGRDWAEVVRGYRTALEHRDALNPKQIQRVEAMFREVEANLNAITNLLREVRVRTASGGLNEEAYLERENLAIKATYENFTERVIALREDLATQEPQPDPEVSMISLSTQDRWSRTRLPELDTGPRDVKMPSDLTH